MFDEVRFENLADAGRFSGMIDGELADVIRLMPKGDGHCINFYYTDGRAYNHGRFATVNLRLDGIWHVSFRSDAPADTRWYTSPLAVVRAVCDAEHNSEGFDLLSAASATAPGRGIAPTPLCPSCGVELPRTGTCDYCG